MNKKQLESFINQRDRFKEYTESITGKESGVIPVYNSDLDLFDKTSEIKYILLADNPGREEAAEHRYLIGHAGRQARNFFENSGLVKDFSKEVMVLNKTCIHTAATGDLRKLKKNKLLSASQRFMAGTAFGFHIVLNCDLWIIGCSEIRAGGIFSDFKDTLTEFYASGKTALLKNRVFCYKHFSYGNFSHDLKEHKSHDLNVKLTDIGTEMRMKTFGW